MAGIVHQHIDASKLLERRFDGLPALICVGHVQPHRERVLTMPRREFLYGFRLACRHDNFVVIGQSRFSQGTAEAAGSASNKVNFVHACVCASLPIITAASARIERN